jgi:hypothetical protein
MESGIWNSGLKYSSPNEIMEAGKKFLEVYLTWGVRTEIAPVGPADPTVAGSDVI